jgi:hypothetical protein
VADEQITKAKDAKARLSRPWRILNGALVALVTAAVGCGTLFALDTLRENVRVSAGYQMMGQSLRLVKGPPWMTPGILAELDVGLLDPEFPRRFSLLDEDVCRRVAAAYERCLWVERVEKIVKHDPRVDPRGPPLEVYLKFRRPLAFVQVRDTFCLVDEKGVRLPGTYEEPRLGAAKFLVVTGVAPCPPGPGRPWLDAGLQAAVKVAGAVEPRREQFRLASIDVSNFGGRLNPRDTEIALYTANNTRIKWGKAPSPEAAMLQEKTLTEKVMYLEHVYKSLNGRVDGVLAYIDIPNEAIRRRAAPDAVTTRVRS